jgi:hypothetical protein
MNKYEKWYTDITDRARNRTVTGYTESHHVIPRSLGGSDDADNLVELTAREHFVCHWLLTKIHTGESRNKMIYALRMMRAEKHGQQRYESKITARVYESIKRDYAVIQSERVSGENNPMYGDKFFRSEEGKQRQRDAVSGINNGAKQTDARKKISESKEGKKREPFSDEWRAKLSAAKQGENNNRYGVEVSEETRAKQRAKALGRKQSAETVQKKADAIRGLKREKRHCPHCDQMIAVNTYARWHGSHCSAVSVKNPP